ncbi:MAG: methyl-accepting chemotaxis protein [Oscillospiraceae bacterium]
MKSIKTQLMVVICLLITISLVAVGGTVSLLMYKSSVESLEKTMSETAKVASSLVEADLKTYKTVANETGLVARLSNDTVSIEDKKTIISNKVKQYGFVGADYVDISGESFFGGPNISDADYFQAAAKGETVVSNLILSKNTNSYTINVAAPVWDKGLPNTSVVGVIYFNVNPKILSDIMAKIEIGKTGGAYILDKDNYTIAHQNYQTVLDRDNTLESFKSEPMLKPLVDLETKMTKGESGFGIYKYNGVKKTLAYSPVETGQGWSLAVTAELNEFIQSTINAIVITLVLVAVAVVVGIFITLWLARSITKPLVEVETAALKMAEGDYDVIITYKSKNELGSLADSMRSMMLTTKDIIIDTSRGLVEIANGNFNVRPQAEYIGVFTGVKDAMLRIITDLSNTMEQIQTASDQVSLGSEQVSGGAQALAQGSTEQASSVQELSASITEIAQEVKNNAANAANANEKVGVVGSSIHESNEQMSHMMGAMSEISDSSQQIGKIIKTIEDIAFQTNILALNAAVEAARAGAAGKGFAVVADEVRNLATKSSEAAKQTNVLIENSVNLVSNGVQIATDTAKSLQEVVDGAQDITELIAKISNASAGQSESVTRINLGVEQISSVVQMNSATAEQSAAASEELSGQALMLKSLVSTFKLKE